MNRKCTMATIAFLMAAGAAWGQAPLGTVFTYQGRLTGGGAPVSGSYDLEFTLYDADTNGSLVAGPICADGVMVADGLFTLELDFGSAFNGDERWLEVGVRADEIADNCAAGAYTMLEPRQSLTAAPYALKSKSAYALDAADGGPANAVLVNDVGNVGIGVASPQQKLDVNGTMRVSGGVIQKGGTAVTGTSDLGLYSMAAGWMRFVTNNSPIQFITNSTEGSALTPAASSIKMSIQANGNVGIGTATPVAGLHVSTDAAFGLGLGEMRIRSVTPADPGWGPLIGVEGIGIGSLAGGNRQMAMFTDGSSNQPIFTVASSTDSGVTWDSRLAVLQGGNVGIGTTTPSLPMTVQGRGTNSNAIQLRNSSGENLWHFSLTGGGLDFVETGVAANRLYLAPGGNVGIGTSTPAERLTVAGTIRSTSGGFKFPDGSVQSSAAVGGGEWAISGNHIHNTNSGNVGIGTAAPGARLHVNGTARFDDKTQIGPTTWANVALTIDLPLTYGIVLEQGGALKPGGGSWGNASDARLKKNIRTMEGALETLMALRGVNFEYLDPRSIGELEGVRTGFIAQEVEHVIPDWVGEFNGHKVITIRGFEALTVEALRALRAEKDAQLAQRDARIASLEREMQELKDMVRHVSVQKGE